MRGTHDRKVNGNVRWLMGQVHVATAYEDVAEDITSRVNTYNENPDPRMRARLVTDALVCHLRNRRVYSAVMSGRLDLL